MTEEVLEKLKKKKRIFPFQVQPPPDYESRESSREWFRGPLGIWPWPIVNLLLALIEAIKAKSYVPPTQVFPRTASRRVEYIRDKEGRIIEKYEEIELA